MRGGGFVQDGAKLLPRKRRGPPGPADDPIVQGERVYRIVAGKASGDATSVPNAFIVDLGQFQPEASAIEVHSRVVMSPTYAKILSGMLSQAIDRYQAANGLIADVADEFDPMEIVHR